MKKKLIVLIALLSIFLSACSSQYNSEKKYDKCEVLILAGKSEEIKRDITSEVTMDIKYNSNDDGLKDDLGKYTNAEFTLNYYGKEYIGIVKEGKITWKGADPINDGAFISNTYYDDKLRVCYLSQGRFFTTLCVDDEYKYYWFYIEFNPYDLTDN